MTPSEPQFEVSILGVIGVVLIFINGVVVLVIGTIGSPSIQFTQDAVVAGVASLFLAILLGTFLGLYWDSTDTEDQSTWGTLIVIVGAFSLWFGGGFVVGFVLAVTAGVLAIVLSHLPQTTFRTDSFATRSRATFRRAPGLSPQGVPAAPVPSEATPPTDASAPIPGTVVWYCMKCGSRNRLDAAVCATCGAPRGAPA